MRQPWLILTEAALQHRLGTDTQSRVYMLTYYQFCFQKRSSQNYTVPDPASRFDVPHWTMKVIPKDIYYAGEDTESEDNTFSVACDNDKIGSMDKPGENASSDRILVGKDLRVQLTEGRHGSCLSTGADACVKVSVAMLSPPQKYMTGEFIESIIPCGPLCVKLLGGMKATQERNHENVDGSTENNIRTLMAALRKTVACPEMLSSQ
ncbi:hypothetical protein Q9966_010512 [Columba livia]|nr:hypothetical protein Q9966_010512 [Columba livia]